METGINKQQSKIIKGTAILLMIYHHLFVLAGDGIYGASLSFTNTAPITTLAYFGKICVGLFAFVTGYAIRKVFSNTKNTTVSTTFRHKIISEYRYVLTHIVQLYLFYYLSLIIFVPISSMLGGISPEALHTNNILSNLLGLSTDYDGSVWYITFYSLMLLISPLLDLFFEKTTSRKAFINKLQILLCGLCIFLFAQLYLTLKSHSFILGIKTMISIIKPSFALCFVVGYLSSRFCIYELLHSKAFYRMNKYISTLLGIIIIVITCTIRMILADSAAYADHDFLIVPFFILGLILFTNNLKILRLILSFFGKYSTFMWLTHLHIVGIMQSSLLSIISNHLIFYLAIVLLALITSIILTSLSKTLIAYASQITSNEKH